MASTITPNMNLISPTVGSEAGPQYAYDIDNSLTLIDTHDHSSGRGVQITPAGMNFNASVNFNNNSLYNIGGLTLEAQSTTPANSTIYESGNDLYFVDAIGNNIRLTLSGAVAGTPGSISNLVSPASASYIAVSNTFVFQSGANLAGNLDGASVNLRNISPNSTYALTLSPPVLSAAYQLTLPYLPSAQSIMSMSTAGVMSQAYPDNSTLQLSSGTLSVKANGITAAQLAPSVIATTVPSGVISAYAGTAAPTGYLMCDGTSYLQSAYPTLYAAIGNAYGSADSTHFNVPDFRGQFLRGVDAGAGRDPDTLTRTAMNTGGNTGDNVGSVQSYENSSHNHAVATFGVTGAGSSYGGTVADAYSTSQALGHAGFGNAQVGTYTTGSQGGSETRPINAYVNYIIKT